MVSFYSTKASDEAKKLIPAIAIVLYKNDGSDEVACVTEHTIKKDNTMGLGQTVCADYLIDKISMLKTASNKSRNALFPSNLLFDSKELMIWHSPRFVGDMWIRLGGSKHLEPLRVEWPPLLYVVRKLERSIAVFAMGSNKRPGPTTALYHAPLMNLNGEGILCLGTSRLPQEFDYTSLVSCQEALIDSQFTHIGHDDTLRGSATNEQHLDFWKDKAAKSGKPKRVFVREMAPFKSLGELIEDLNCE